MKPFPLLILMCLVLLVSVSCLSRKPPAPVVLQNTKEITHIVRDTAYKVEADSSYYQAYVQCRDGKPFIIKDSIKRKEGKNVTAKVALKNNKLSVDCKQKALELFKTWRETYTKAHEQTPIYVPQVEYRDKVLTTWQTTQLWFGRIFMGLLAIILLFTLLRWKKLI